LSSRTWMLARRSPASRIAFTFDATQKPSLLTTSGY
jgi:hypothetical protein